MSDQSQLDALAAKNRVERLTAVLSKGMTLVVHAYIVFVEVILMLGFVLLLFGANPTSSFVQWVYRSLGRAMEPFQGIFAPIELGVTGMPCRRSWRHPSSSPWSSTGSWPWRLHTC